MGALFAAMPDLRYAYATDLTTAEGDKVVSHAVASGTHTGAPLFGTPASGKKITWTQSDVGRVANGKIVERWFCADSLALLQQIGALPTAGLGPATPARRETMEKAVDVAIVGCGPVGVTAANLLGMYGISAIVIEKEAEPHNLPRASSTDDEIMRIFQTVGLADQLMRDMSPAKGVRWVSGSGEVLAELPFTETDVGLGYPAQIFFWQPDLEQILRAGASRFGCVEVCLSNEVEALSQDSEGATLSVRDKLTGEAWSAKAKYVLGCDGGRSTIRQLAGIHLTGSTSEHPWLVVDVAVKEPLPGLAYLHLDCNPNRPSVNYPMPLGHHRWEFMVMPGESSEELERVETVESLLSKYVNPREVQIVRKAVYRFHERVAEHWHVGCVYLLGDAAHLMPPISRTGYVFGHT